MTSEKKSRPLRGYLIRFVLFGTLAVLCTLAVTDGAYFLAGLLGMGAVFTGRHLVDRKGTRRRELWRWARENARELSRVAHEDRIAAPQVIRLERLQTGLLESWELLPEGYRPLLDDDIYTIMGEVEGAARLARRRAALRRHLDSVDRLVISRRIEDLEQEVAELGENSPLRAPLETALDGRPGELASGADILKGISMINAQLEGAESLLANLRGELLALDTGLAHGSLDTDLAPLKSRVAYFRQSMDEVTRSVETLPAATIRRGCRLDERAAPSRGRIRAEGAHAPQRPGLRLGVVGTRTGPTPALLAAQSRANRGGGFVDSKVARMTTVSIPLPQRNPISRSDLRGRSPPLWALTTCIALVHPNRKERYEWRHYPY